MGISRNEKQNLNLKTKISKTSRSKQRKNNLFAFTFNFYLLFYLISKFFISSISKIFIHLISKFFISSISKIFIHLISKFFYFIIIFIFSYFYYLNQSKIIFLTILKLYIPLQSLFLKDNTFLISIVQHPSCNRIPLHQRMF